MSQQPPFFEDISQDSSRELLYSDKPFLAAVTHIPSPIVAKNLQLSREDKIEKIASHFRQIMETLGLDLDDPSLDKTPDRVAKMYVDEVFSGLSLENFPRVSFVEDPVQTESSSSFISLKAGFTSFCEHHFVPFSGQAYIAYRPNGKLIGLSKIPRIVRYFAKRPQLQERLTAQIADALSILLETEDIAICVIATHFCVVARGVEDENSQTTTHHFRGCFNSDPSAKREFYEALRRMTR